MLSRGKGLDASCSNSKLACKTKLKSNVRGTSRVGNKSELLRFYHGPCPVWVSGPISGIIVE